MIHLHMMQRQVQELFCSDPLLWDAMIPHWYHQQDWFNLTPTVLKKATPPRKTLRPTAERHRADSLAVMRPRGHQYILYFIFPSRSIQQNDRTRFGSLFYSTTGTLCLTFCIPSHQARRLAPTETALPALSCPLSLQRHMPADQGHALFLALRKSS